MIIPKYYEDVHTTDVNTLLTRAYYIPTSPEQCADWSNRRDTDRFYLLNGEWTFRYFESIYDCKDAFYEENYSPVDFGTIPVPSNWQDHGCDIHQYTNTRYPFPFDPPYVPHENPCGAYIREFDYAKPAGTDRVFLNFEGVDSCYYVWMNGTFVGYHQVSHSTGEYEVTNMIREGKNRLCVLVLKWCDGSYLEDQDKFRASGIFRDVYLLSRPKDFIRDYFVHTTLKNDYKDAEIKVDLFKEANYLAVTYELTDKNGNLVASGTTTADWINITVENADLWNAEQPNLYTLILKTDNEVIREKIGLREICVKDSIVYLNGKKLRFRGVNRHDSDPTVSYAVDVEHIRRDMKLMKEHNFNAIRTSHYPNAPEFYNLADEYGFYIIAEADLEIHGVVNLFHVNIWEEGGEHPFPPFICDNPVWSDAIVDRSRKSVMREKNRPCVVIWSIGNESGYGNCLENALAWIKSYDKSRLTHYEGSLHRPRNPIKGKNNYSDIDLRSRMYASIPEMHAYLQDNPDKPFIQCEFIHAMGNGPGDIEDYYKLEEQYDTYCGGFVWEWCDHGVDMGKTEAGVQKFYYGGDSGEYPHDGNFCMDGMVHPDRKPTTGLYEYKNVHRPVRVLPVDPAAGKYILQNNWDFQNIKDAAYLTYEILKDGIVVSTGEIRDTALLDVEPRTKTEVTLPIEVCAEGNTSVIIRTKKLVADAFRPEGFELGFDQIMISEESTSTLKELLASTASVSADAVSYKEDDRVIDIIGADFCYKFNKLTGMIDSMNYKNYSFLDQPMGFNVWRAPTDNDRVVKRLWYQAGYNELTERTYNVSVAKGDNGSIVITAISGLAPIYRQKYLDVTAKWTIFADGTINVAFDVEKDAYLRGTYGMYFDETSETLDRKGIVNTFEIRDPYLPRLGMRMFLPKEMNQAAYFGYGPYESYVDKHHADYVGHFESSVASLYEEYLRPQENGSHYGCEYVSVASDKQKMTVYNDSSFCFNLSEYSQEELTRKDHNYELEKCGSTVFCIDHVQSGIGSGSCGPQLIPEYRINGTHYKYNFYIKPEVL